MQVITSAVACGSPRPCTTDAHVEFCCVGTGAFYCINFQNIKLELYETNCVSFCCNLIFQSNQELQCALKSFMN